MADDASSLQSNTTMRSHQELKKEQKRAISTFFDHIHNFHHFLNNSSTISQHGNLLPTGFIATSYQPFHVLNIPRCSYWQWNQSNAKVTIRVENGILVTFRKLCVKRKQKIATPEAIPSFKVWIFDIDYGKFAPSQHLLWCEKGQGLETDIGTIFPAEVSTADLSFLKPFMDQRKAQELGW